MTKIENELKNLEKLKNSLKSIIDLDNCIEYYFIDRILINSLINETKKVENVIISLRNVYEDKENAFEEGIYED